LSTLRTTPSTCRICGTDYHQHPDTPRIPHQRGQACAACVPVEDALAHVAVELRRLERVLDVVVERVIRTATAPAVVLARALIRTARAELAPPQ